MTKLPEWKLRQKIYHATHPIKDKVDPLILSADQDEEIISRAIGYFSKPWRRLYYPSKSFAVAIIYAKLLERYFEADFYSVLDDPDLLYGNDHFFVRYSEAKNIYDKIIKAIPQEIEDSEISNVQETVAFFKEEFHID